jgi:hypothetical protein
LAAVPADAATTGNETLPAGPAVSAMTGGPAVTEQTGVAAVPGY